jgi:hypothetical protein
MVLRGFSNITPKAVDYQKRTQKRQPSLRLPFLANSRLHGPQLRRPQTKLTFKRKPSKAVPTGSVSAKDKRLLI